MFWATNIANKFLLKKGYKILIIHTEELSKPFNQLFISSLKQVKRNILDEGCKS